MLQCVPNGIVLNRSVWWDMVISSIEHVYFTRYTSVRKTLRDIFMGIILIMKGRKNYWSFFHLTLGGLFI